MTDIITRGAAAMAARRRELIAQPLDRIWPDLMCAAVEAMQEPDAPQGTPVGCRCARCLDANWAASTGQTAFPPSRRRMVVCQTCGNKRCPHATDHNLTCTQSNEPGQAGSAYA